MPARHNAQTRQNERVLTIVIMALYKFCIIIIITAHRLQAYKSQRATT